MLHRKHTAEFSVIGLLDVKAAEDIAKIRKLLPPSPYRDDQPHLTFVYKVRTPRNISDHELAGHLAPVFHQSLKLPVHAKVAAVTNRRGSLYGRSSVILLHLAPEFKDLRNGLLSSFHAHGFKTNHMLDALYLPHTTIRLGVPIKGVARQEAVRLFPKGRSINIRTLEIYRLISENSHRLFYPIKVR